MTKQDYELLGRYEMHFVRAMESSYCRYIPLSDMKRMVEIYKQTSPNAHYNIACAKCKLNLLKDVGRLYFAEKEKRTNKKHGSKREKQAKSCAKRDGLGVGERTTA